MKFFWTKTNPPSTQLHVRDLKPGMKVPFDKGIAEIERLELMNGQNGEQLTFIGGGSSKSAVAVRVHFVAHDPVIAHPNDIIVYF